MDSCPNCRAKFLLSHTFCPECSFDLRNKINFKDENITEEDAFINEDITNKVKLSYEKKYFYSDGNEKHGPLSLNELAEKDISRHTLIWCEGLDDWTLAEKIIDVQPILQLKPPSIDNIIIEQIEPNVKKQNFISKAKKLEPKEATDAFIIAGFIFCFLGGYLGFIIGLNYALGNYKKEVKILGWIMTVLSFFSAAIWRSL